MMKILSKEELEKLTTPRILAYKKRLLQIPDAKCSCGAHLGDCDLDIPPGFYKSSSEWQACYLAVKEVLATREHVRCETR
jgi:hypothetical protein